MFFFSRVRKSLQKKVLDQQNFLSSITFTIEYYRFYHLCITYTFILISMITIHTITKTVPCSPFAVFIKLRHIFSTILSHYHYEICMRIALKFPRCFLDNQEFRGIINDATREIYRVLLFKSNFFTIFNLIINLINNYY